MADDFESFQPALSSPAFSAEAITPDDGAELGSVTRGVYVGNGGDLTVTMKSGDVVTFANVPSGGVLALRIAKVFFTGTTASGLVGLR